MKRFHESDLRKRRFSEFGSCYSVTKCVEGRRHYLVSDPKDPVIAEATCEIIVSSLRWLHEAERILCFGYVVMPDHVHTTFVLLSNASVSSVMESFCKFTARKLNRSLNRVGQFWQHSYYERMVRDDDEFHNQLNYMRENPVRAG